MPLSTQSSKGTDEVMSSANTGGEKKSDATTAVDITAEESSKSSVGVSTGDERKIRRSPVLHGWRLYTVSTALAFALFLGGIDSSIVATALVTIGKDFNNFIKLQWVILSYLLTYLGFALIFSRISDVVGRKWTSVAALLILTAGSLGAGLAKTMNQLIAFRAVQGIGGAGVYAMSLTATPEITPPKQFPFVGALTGIATTCSSLLGPLLGGVITTRSTWRWVFYFNIPCAAFAIILIIIAWPSTAIYGQIPWHRLDLIGGILYGGFSVLLVFALQEAGAEVYAWSSAVIVSCLVVAVVSATAMCFWIWYLSSRERFFAPLFPARIVTNRIILVDILASTLAGYLLFTTVVELPVRFQIVNGTSAESAGLRLLPYLLSASFAAFFAVLLSTGKHNWTFYTLIGSSVLAIVGCGLLSSIPFSFWVPRTIYVYEIILGLGIGGLLVTPIISIKLNTPDDDAAPAQGLSSQCRILGGNIGLSLATIIQNARLTSDLAGILTPEQITSLKRSLNTIATLNQQEVGAVANSFSKAFTTQLQVCVGIAGLAIIVCCFAWQRHPPTVASIEEQKKRRELEQSPNLQVNGEQER